MQRVHFIAIGGSAMSNLAITISKRENIKVTGSDAEIYEPSMSRLKLHKLMPDKLGWFTDKIDKNLNAVVVGMHITQDNPELKRAKELSLKIYSFPEYIYQQTRSKTRIVVGGSYGKTLTAAMILHVLLKLKIDTDYMISEYFLGLDNTVKLTYEARIAVIEGDENMTSPVDQRPKFHLYKSHIAVITGIVRKNINFFPHFEDYIENFRQFTESMEMQGRLIYFEKDENLRKISEKLRRDIVAFPYDIPEHEIRNGITYLKTRKGEVKLKIFGEQSLQNLNAARLACRQIGIYDDQFFSVISDFSGITDSLQKIVDTNDFIAIKDCAHTPTRIKEAIQSVKYQYPEKKLIACIELNEKDLANEDFLLQEPDCFENADKSYIFISSETTRNEQNLTINHDQIKLSFKRKNTEIFSDIETLKQKLKAENYQNSALLFMSAQNFCGTNLIELSENLITG